MFWIGKLLGALFGFLLLGPVGALIGVFIGHHLDTGIKRQYQGRLSDVQQAFFQTTFMVMGHIAKADGRVSETETQIAENTMARMQLSAEQRLQAIAFFTQGKQHDFDLNQHLKQLKQACRFRHDLLRIFVEIQIQAAYASGTLTHQKQRILEGLCQSLGFGWTGFNQFHSQYRAEENFSKEEQSPDKRLKDAYNLLGVDEKANVIEIKKAYRKLMSQHHPDKLMAKGLPDEMIKLANQKTQQIRTAYELVLKEKGVAA